MSNNPFRYDNWLNHDGDGGKKTTDEVLLGQNNRIHSPDDGNPLSYTLTGATIIDVRTPKNAALVGNNGCLVDAGIGVYGHADTLALQPGVYSGPGMGVVGSCDAGLGVVGLALSGDAPSLPEGVGVFGTGDNVGVQGLGGSKGGKGMFGQGGGGTAQGMSPGVVGNAGTSAPNDGVQGFGSGNFSGVAGFGDPRGNGTGVFGNGGGPQSAGVRGIGGGESNTVPITAAGVYGQAGSGNANGVEGRGSGNYAGVAGFGDATNGAASGIGVFAVGGAPAPGSSQPGGPGVHAIGAGGAPFTPLNQAVGVYGLGGAGDAVGVLGQGGSAVADGVRGFSTSGSAISGESSNGVGVRAFSSSGTGVVAEGDQLVPGTIGLIATGNALAAQFNGKVLINGDLTVSGTVHSVTSALHLGRTRVTMASDAAVTLSSAQYGTQILEIVSSVSLASTRDIVLPLSDGMALVVHNGTAGGKSLRFIGSSGSGVTVGNGKRAIVYCDGANWNRVTADT